MSISPRLTGHFYKESHDEKTSNCVNSVYSSFSFPSFLESLVLGLSGFWSSFLKTSILVSMRSLAARLL
jgi:hypothetical protein